MIQEQNDSNSKFRSGKFFFGWFIVATMVAVTFAQTALYNPALSVFLKPITEEFGWSRSVFAGAITVGTILGGFLALVIGPILDKKGSKMVLFFGFIFFGLAVASIFFINHLWQFYISVVTGRFIIAGLLQIAPGVVVSKWFIRRRGRAMAFAVVGTRFGQMAMPLIAQISLSIVGWRSGSVVLALVVWAATLLPILIFLKRQPEDMGLLPDGVEPSGTKDESYQSLEVIYSLKEAIRTPAFYFILIATSGLMFNIGGINFNLFPYLTDRGIPEESAITVLTLWAGVSALGAVGVGFVVEKFHIRNVMAIGFVIVTMGVGILMLTDNLYYAYSFAIVHGLAFGALPMLIQLVWAEYFGRAHQGSIRGFVTPIQLVIQAGGPLAGTFMYDIMGDYYYALILFALVYIVSALAILMAKPLALVQPN
tara:strand:- start:292 stop:1563 length:1272 start_codon:yes stop_codon:yes gene_type:complete